MGLEPLPDLPDKAQRAVLSLSGGGFAGLFAACVLERLEADLGPLGRIFDLFAGTSVGGLLALGLASGKPAAELRTTIESLGPDVFPRRLRLGFLAPKHDPGPLAAALTGLFGDMTLGAIEGRALVPAVDLNAAETVVFRSYRVEHAERRIVDVALATSAAPLFLAAQRADDRVYVDGGLAANSPEAIAAIEAMQGLAWGAERIQLLSIGATRAPARIPGYLDAGRWGLRGWLKQERLVKVAMAAQMTLARQTCLALLGPDRVAPIDVELSAEEAKVVGLDKADDKAIKTLRTLAAGAYDRFRSERAVVYQYLQRRASRSGE